MSRSKTTLDTLLSNLNATAPLDFDNFNGVLRVSTKEDIKAREPAHFAYVRESYDVSDLITPSPQRGVSDAATAQISVQDRNRQYARTGQPDHWPHLTRIMVGPSIPPNPVGRIFSISR